MKLKKKILFITVCLSALFLQACSSTTELTQESTVSVVDNVEQYSRISSSELKSLMGEPASTESWSLQSPSGEYLVETYSYDKDLNHYEFIIADDSVIRTSIYSDKYWNKGENTFEYTKENDIPEMFGIRITDTTQGTQGSKNGLTFILSPVNDKIANVEFGDVSNNTFGYAKVTYNVKYFE
nr:hypothetical protein [uncultured Cellulosilyticum sp.]